MRERSRRVVALVWIAGAAAFLLLGPQPGTDASAEVVDRPAASGATMRDPHIPPRKRRKLLDWLVAGNYLATYAAEPAVHDSLGPHGGNVRTYYNPILVDDLRAGRTTWSRGAAMVKELYASGKDEVRGYSVMIKTRADSGPNGEGWLFFETFNLTGGNAYYGRGLGVCTNCHQAGTDYLLSAFRPE
jgi:hypothetical protein